MLILTGRLGESVVIEDYIVVTVSAISNNQIFIINKWFNPKCLSLMPGNRSLILILIFQTSVSYNIDQSLAGETL